MIPRYQLIFILLILSFPQTVLCSTNQGLIWAINEGDSLEYEFSYSDYSYNTQEFTATHRFIIHFIFQKLPEINQSLHNMTDLPLVDVQVSLDNSTKATLNEIAWMPEWFIDWRPIFTVLPIGNFDLLREIEINHPPPSGLPMLWERNDTAISWGSLIEIDGMGFTTSIDESYSRSDGALLEYSFQYDDLFCRTNFNLVRVDLRALIETQLVQTNILIWSVASTCLLISMSFLFEWAKINRTIGKFQTRR